MELAQTTLTYKRTLEEEIKEYKKEMELVRFLLQSSTCVVDNMDEKDADESFKVG